jgi:hypothetical protein
MDPIPKDDYAKAAVARMDYHWDADLRKMAHHHRYAF